MGHQPSTAICQSRGMPDGHTQVVHWAAAPPSQMFQPDPDRGSSAHQALQSGQCWCRERSLRVRPLLARVRNCVGLMLLGGGCCMQGPLVPRLDMHGNSAKHCTLPICVGKWNELLVCQVAEPSCCTHVSAEVAVVACLVMLCMLHACRGGSRAQQL